MSIPLPPEVVARIRATAADGTLTEARPDPPLDGTALIEGQPPDVLPAMMKLAGGAGLARLQRAMADRANERNLLLYAGEKGLFRFVGPVDARLARHRANVLALYRLKPPLTRTPRPAPNA